MSLIAPPKTVQDVVALVRRLYEPGTPDELSDIQSLLQEVQRSADGWATADALLAVPDQNVQFFGALTFTVKLNSDWESLSKDDIPGIRDRLVGWFIELVAQGAPQLVTKKLCSTLVVFFMRFSEIWADCVRQLLCCISVGYAASHSECATLSRSSQLVGALRAEAKLSLLWFAATLVEEISKVDCLNFKSQHYYIKLRDNMEDVVELLRDTLSTPSVDKDDFDRRIVDSALKTFQSWVLCSSRVALDSGAAFSLLRSLTGSSIGWLAKPETFETASDVVIDILSRYFAFLTSEDVLYLADFLTSSSAIQQYKRVITGDSDWDSIQFSRLLVTFAEATVQDLAQQVDTSRSQLVMQMLHGILGIPGYPQVDEEISSTTFEFWGSFVEYLLDSQYISSADDDSWIDDGKREVSRAVEEFWFKIRMPGQEVVSWTKDEREGFMSFRKDVADFVESVYGLLGVGLFERLVAQVLASIADTVFETAWTDIEASLFCLNSLSDSLNDEPAEYVYLERLFGSSLFTLLSDLSSKIPLKARTTSVNLIGSYAHFFERRPKFLPAVLNFLFSCILTSSLARNASKSISSLCSSCRSTLTGELATFLYQYGTFAKDPGADDTAKERVICAISFIIQALPCDEDKLMPIENLLEFIEQDIQRCLGVISESKETEAKEIGILSLRCLASVGKGLQAPEDIPIFLTGEVDALPSFWNDGDGAQLQRRIVGLVRLLVTVLREDGEIVDAACAVFRTGFVETLPGLFVFPPAVVTEFILERGTNAPRIETILYTASTLISSHSLEGSKDITAEAISLFEFTLRLIDQVQDPHVEPEISQGIIEVLTRLLKRYVYVIVQYEPKERVENLFLFLLEALAVRETLVKKTAAGFWSTLLSLADLAPYRQACVDDVIRACGPALAERLVWAIGGGCARSEIDSMAEPLKKLVVRQVRSKSWLSEALVKAASLTPNVTDTDRRFFLEKVMRYSLRGRKGTNQVAKEFWLKCRGTEFAYVS